MSKPIPYVAVLLFSLTLFAAPPKKSPTPVDPELRTLEDVFNTTADKADRDADRIKSQASERRLEGYRNALKIATKAGDFDKATKIKARIVELEALSPGQRGIRPKDTFRFKGHTYAIIKDPATWHVAKKKCEDLGGHLATVESEAESVFLQSRCRNPTITVWVGGTDEITEGDWRWVTGEKVAIGFRKDNANGAENAMSFYGPTDSWEDLFEGTRLWFICEWDN